MKEYTENDSFGFEPNHEQNSFNYNNISGLGESDYENEDLFSVEVSNGEERGTFKPDPITENKEDLGYNLEFPIDYETSKLGENEKASNYDFQVDIPRQSFKLEDNKINIDSFGNEQEIVEEDDNDFINYNQNNDFWLGYNNETNQNTSVYEEQPAVENSFNETPSYESEPNFAVENNTFESGIISESEQLNDEEQPIVENSFNETPSYESEPNFTVENNTFQLENISDSNDEEQINSIEQPVVEKEEVNDFIPQTESDDSAKVDSPNNSDNVDGEFLEPNGDFDGSSLQDDHEYPIVEPSVESKAELFEETPIEELNKLTEFKEDKIETTDINSLFDRVGVNVKEASDIFKKNTEMKEKIDSRFEELKKLQSEVEKAKKIQYDEINSYKEEVLNKLTEKKEEIEKRLNKLREFQASLEKEKQEFEQYKKAEKEEIERVQKEVQDAYDSRREELNHIEDVLRKQKDALDEERSQLSLDIIQYESDKNELANNLLKFNEIVDSFTNGMDKINKE